MRGESAKEAAETPILRAYLQVKSAHPDCLIMVRLGDFFELFGEDAEAAAPILGVTLTGRNFGRSGRMPMCGVPHHAIYSYVRRLLDANYRVALWDQVGEVASGRLVDRSVTRIFSPGTIIEDELLTAQEVSRCVSVFRNAHGIGVAAIDPASAEIELQMLAPEATMAEVDSVLSRLLAREVLLPEEDAGWLRGDAGYAVTKVDAAHFTVARAQQRLREALGVSTLRALETEHNSPAICAAGAGLAYVSQAGLEIKEGTIFLRPKDSVSMRLDHQTLHNLEVLKPLHQKGISLAEILDHTCTPMGARGLRRRLAEPSCDVEVINSWQSAVAEMCDERLRQAVREPLQQIRDLERLITRCLQGMASGRELMAVRNALLALPALGDLLATTMAQSLRQSRDRCYVAPEIASMLVQFLAPEGNTEEGYIRPGADAELDQLRQTASAGRDFISELEQSERERTGIKSLKIGYNRLIGYYIEVPQAYVAKVPPEYQRKHGLTGAERFVTVTLKDQEVALLGAKSGASLREDELLSQCRQMVAQNAGALMAAAKAVAEIDIAQALAHAALIHRWIRPEVDQSMDLEVESGRHPLVEQAVGNFNFIANDCRLDQQSRLLIITGPNMGGKSTYLRQIATIVLMAQIGGYVPAKKARVGIVDRIFTRIGAQDDVSGGMSTFMVEMAEAATILHQASSRSLLILDEIGRGTSTFDGMAIAQAIIEHLRKDPRLQCRTLFATHYHELTRLSRDLIGVDNAHTEVMEGSGGEIVFTHRVVPGAADKSYGIHVATLAGVPGSVVKRAQEILQALERSNGSSPAAEHQQLDFDLPSPPEHPVIQELLQLSLDEMTPLLAINKLAQLQAQAGEPR